MKNADEHAKLLAQIAELERNSVNYFDVEREFFLIDSNNLHTVRPRLYGYSIQATGIYEDDNLTEEAIAGLDGRGCYVYVEVKDGTITIKQDLNGCWGIYLFRHGDYFALSNSFFRLLDHIKFKYPLTVNRDYCYYLWVEALCSNAYSETAVNEIELLDRSAILHIDIAKRTFDIELINYKEHSIYPDSEEGIATLDRWFEFWVDVLRGVARNTEFISADLSGGFDSRVSIIPLLHSGIDLSKVRFNSARGIGHTLKEDYEIASQIAEHYGFKLNSSYPPSKFLNYSLADIFKSDLYINQTFSNISKLRPQKRTNKAYLLNGGGGETIRLNWSRFESLEKFIENRIMRTNVYSVALARDLSYSTEQILKSAFNDIGRRYGMEDNPEMILQYLVQETQCRNHFGKDSAISHTRGVVQFSTVIDPVLRMVRYNSPECKDYNLLVTLIFTRYEPNLLTFPFNSNRSIAPETIEYAKQINERFPICHQNANILTGGGYFTYSRVTSNSKKSFLQLKITPTFPAACPKLV